MFVIKNSQIEAMKLPIRQQKRGQMLVQLHANGFNAKEGEGNDLVIEDSRGNKTRLVFDEKYTPQKIVKPSGLEYAFNFDSNDHLVKFSFPGNESIGFSYHDDLLKAIMLNEGRIGLNYDDKGRITEVISQDNKSYKISYNVSAQVESITNRANETRRFDSAIKGSHLVHSMKDSLGRVTQVETDPVGEAGDKISFPDGTEQTTAYDENMDALVTTLRSGAKVHTYYDGASPSKVEWEDGNFQNLELNGEQVNAIKNPAGTLRFEYDDKGRVLSEEFQGNKTNYIYDKDGNLLEMAYPSGLVVKYSYDEDGRLQSLKVGDDTCTYQYGPNDTLAEVYYPNGLTQKRSEKVLGGLKGTQVVNPSGTVLSQQDYQYDNLYRLTRYNNFDASSRHPSRDWQFHYDDEWRLLSSVEAISQRLERFEYDHKGNLSSVDGSPVTVGRMDEVLSMGGSTVQYDANGNVRSFVNAQGRTVALTFNDNNELKLARIGDDTWEYWYDGLGRRVGKSNGREAYKFCWGSEKLLTEEVRTPDGTAQREYIYSHNAAVPVAFRENGHLFWLHSDVRGAVTQVFDSFGQVVWSAEYSAFGEANIHRGSIRQPWRLTGQYHDAETGLHYSTARYYSPHLKSFLSLDRYWFKYEAGNYVYAGNDPWNKVDREGNMPDWISTAGSIAAGIAVGAVVTAGVIAAAPALGIGVVAAAAIGLVAGGVIGGVTEVVVENSLKGEDICIPCALMSGVIGGIMGIIPFGRLFGKAAQGLKSILGKLTGKGLGEAAEKIAKEGVDLIIKKGDPGTPAAREAMAREFYERAGWPQSRIDSHLKGIDFKKPVEIVEIPKGSNMSQWQAPGQNKGNYFAEQGTDPSKLGISPNAADKFNANNRIPKTESPYVSEKPVEALKSTSSPVKDTWSESISGPDSPNSFVIVREVETQGGATQFFVPENSAFK